MEANDADVANDAVPNNDPVTPLPLRKIPLLDITNDPVMTADPLNGNPFCATLTKDAVVANDAVGGVNVMLVAALAVVANDDVKA